MNKSNEKRARPLMVQGTSSHVGKSVLTAALCRIFRDRGLRAAPFKAQNMALNSFVTVDGCEIGRAQAFQAEAAGIVPSVDMNPVLLKPTGDSVSQVIVHGRVFGVMGAIEYHAFKKEAARYVMESYERLAVDYDVIVIEGAGSPAEVNLREGDIANMGVAEMVDSPVLLVGDIDRGGVFASLVGTIELLTPSERERVKGFIINKFRGDISLLRPGLDFLVEKTRRAVLGVVPYLDNVTLPDEDGVALQGRGGDGGAEGGADLKIAVIKLPRISNFTDLDPLKLSPGVRISLVDDTLGLAGADMAIIPGTKNTISDLEWLKERGFGEALARFAGEGKTIAGICGGFQMMGRRVEDPHGVESSAGGASGLGLLDVDTVLEREKSTFQVRADVVGLRGEPLRVEGYEIHMGRTTGSVAPFAMIKSRNNGPVEVADGAVSGNVWGTYIHGIFDNDAFREEVLAGLRAVKGSGPAPVSATFRGQRDASIKKLADMVSESLDVDAILRIAGLVAVQR